MLVQNNISQVLEDVAEQRIFSFGSFTLDAGRGVLTRDGVNILLRPKSFDVLTYLLKNTGRLVSRKELLEAVWTDVIVTDDSLTQCLIEIRKSLGDDQKRSCKPCRAVDTCLICRFQFLRRPALVMRNRTAQDGDNRHSGLSSP